jgi:nitrate/TMAO reductase-like tetraheme cytochrome c subunit
MLAKNSRWVVILSMALFAMMILGFSQPADVHAAVNLQTADNSCLTCHEDLYYLHDTGCWYCMTDAHKDRCVDCHEGNPAALKEETAHIGLVKHPQENDGAKCLECHTPEEKDVMISTFESEHGGFDTVVKGEPYTPAHIAKTGFPTITEANPLVENASWLGLGVLLFGLWLALVLRS